MSEFIQRHLYADKYTAFDWLKANWFQKIDNLYYVPKEVRKSFDVPRRSFHDWTSFVTKLEISPIELYLQSENLWPSLSDEHLLYLDELYRYTGSTDRTWMIEELKRRDLITRSRFIPLITNPEKYINRAYSPGRWWTIVDGVAIKVGCRQEDLVRYESYYISNHSSPFPAGDYLFEADQPHYNGMPIGYILAVNYGECEECHSLDELDNDDLCHRCRVDGEIANYSARAPDVLPFKGNAKDTFLGIELELNVSRSNLVKDHVIFTKKAMKGHVIVKRDGSVPNGFEIVSCPATYNFHVEEFGKFFDKIPETFIPGNNCGMHIHVDKSRLSDLQIGKINAFMNFKENHKFISHIAERALGNYCRIDYERGKLFSTISGGERYNTINLVNEETIEFRIFASTNKFDTFKKNLQFVKALVEYTTPGNVYTSKLEQHKHHSSFINWIQSQRRKIYPELASHIKQFTALNTSSEGTLV